MANFNWSDKSKESESKQYTLLPTADYVGSIMAAENATSSSGAAMLKVTAAFMHEHDGEKDFAKVYDNITQDWAMDSLGAAAGLPLSTSYGRFATLLVGKTVKAHLIQEEHNGTVRNKVKYYVLPPHKGNNDEF